MAPEYDVPVDPYSRLLPGGQGVGIGAMPWRVTDPAWDVANVRWDLMQTPSGVVMQVPAGAAPTLPWSDKLLLYDHLLAASYTPAFDDTRMLRVLPLSVYLDTVTPEYERLLVSALNQLLYAVDLVPIFQFPDQHASYLRRVLARTTQRMTAPEVHAKGGLVIEGVAKNLHDADPSLRIQVAVIGRPSRSKQQESGPAKTEKERAETAKLRAEAEKLEAETEKIRAETAKIYVETTKLVSQTIRSILLTGTAVFWLILDGYAVGTVEPDRLTPSTQE